MAVAHSSASESHTGTAGSTAASFSWTHTQTGTPKGVVVFVTTFGSSTDLLTSVIYGSSTLTRLSGGAAFDTTGESGRTDVFFLGEGLPSGNQTITVNRTVTGVEGYASAATVTASFATEAVGLVLLSEDGTLAEQNVNDGRPSGAGGLRYASAFSGLAAPPAAGANSTLLTSIDIGQSGAAMVRETTAGPGSRPVGFSSGTSDDRAVVHLAIREKGLAGGSTSTNLITTATEEFSASAWQAFNGITVLSNVVSGPFDVGNADFVREGSTAQPYIMLTATVSPGNRYSFSVYAKAASRKSLSLLSENASLYGSSTFDLALGTKSEVTASIADVGGGWYRCQITPLQSSLSSVFRIRITVQDATGDNASGLYLWGAQLVDGLIAGEYRREPTDFVLERPDATLVKGRTIVGARGVFSLVGRDATLSRTGGSTYPLGVDAGGFSLTPREATLTRTGSGRRRVVLVF